VTDLKVETAISSSQNQEAIDLAKDRYKAGSPLDFGQVLSVLDHKGITLHDKRELAKLYDMDVKDITAAVKGYLKNNDLRNALGNVPKDEYEFVDFQLENWRTTMSFSVEFKIDTPYIVEGIDNPISKEALAELSDADAELIRGYDPKEFALKEMFSRLIKQNRKLGLGFSEKQVENGLERWITRHKEIMSSKIRSELFFESDVLKELAEPEWDRFVDAITDHRKEEAKTMMKHFIWQVKRKMRKLPVKYHTMLIFYGPQEAGKSTVIRDYLCKPVKEFFASTNFKAITDDRSFDIWDNYILFFDEMGHSTTSNLEDIKRRVTEDKFSARILKTNSDTVITNRATFIGASNKDIATLIFDDTGMRRFYQIDCLAKIDWDVTNDIDYIKLWRSVDETKETPLVTDAEILQNIKKIQASKRQLTMMERWLREREHQNFVEELIGASAFFEEFVKFEQSKNASGKSDTNINKFSRTLKPTVINIPGMSVETTKRDGRVFYKVLYEKSTDLD
jgi:hypothetical protein